MKTAIYVDNENTQLVLTPENQFEIGVIEKIDNKHLSTNVIQGSFYECRGGYIRQSVDKQSLIINIKND